MIISKYVKLIEISENVFAVFNSLLMKVFYMSKNEIDMLKNGTIVDNDNVLQKAGILIKDEKTDEMALEALRTELSLHISKIEIMYMIMSTGCNLGCKYCFIENNQDNNHCEINMSSEIIEIAVDKFSKYIKENNIEHPLIIFYGGEPTVNWNGIRKTVECAEQKIENIRFNMVSNGTLLTEDQIIFLSEHGIEVGISIDGPQELNDENRVYRNSEESVYKDVISTIKLFEQHSVKHGLSITVSKQLLENQNAVLSWLTDIKKTNIFFNLYHFTEKDDWESYYLEACDFLIRAYEYLSPCNIIDGRITRKIDSFTNEVFKFTDCASNGGNQITIKPNGAVCVCHGYSKTNQYELGHIFDLSLDNLKISNEFKFWESRVPINRKECIDCEALFICGGGCALQAEALFDNREAMDIPFCMHSKTSLLWLLKKGYHFYTHES